MSFSYFRKKNASHASTFFHTFLYKTDDDGDTAAGKIEIETKKNHPNMF